MSARVVIRGSLLILTLSTLAICATAQRVPPDSVRGARPRAPSGVAADYRSAPSFTAHNQGRIAINLSNHGSFGIPKDVSASWKPTRDPLSKEDVYYCMYPKESGTVWQLWLSFAAGAIRGDDTVVANFYDPWLVDWTEIGTFRFESASRVRPNLYTDSARSDLDIFSVYIDTVPDRQRGQWGHQPTWLKVRQRSMAWSGGGSDDFILVECRVQNIGDQLLRKVYFAVNFDSRVYSQSEIQTDTLPDYDKFLTGFLPVYDSRRECNEPDTINVAYVMSADARPAIKQWTKYSALGVMGARLIHIPAGIPKVNYNWHTWFGNSFAPRRRGTAEEPYRPYSTWYGYVPGDEHEYYYSMSHRETDYDQMYTAVNHYWDGWGQPPENAEEIADGTSSTAMLSFGTIDLDPGEEATIIYAIVGGDSVHVEPTDYYRLWRPDEPWWFYNSLDFSSLAENARWAGWVYDNPGFDTDRDGYVGEYDICDGDTVWYRGDGIPDWRADGPPQSPELRVITSEGRLVLRWNGFVAETTADPLTRVRDFEGYRVYLGLDTRESSLSLIRTFDYENYVRYRLTRLGTGMWEWKATDLPLTIDSLRSYYNDPGFEPLVYDREHPLIIAGVYYCFYSQSDNSSQLSAEGIHKAYPEAVRPSLDSSQWTEAEVTYEHGRRLPRFYEYELALTSLLPTVQYWVSVTSFDFGFATGRIPARESAKDNLTEAWAVTDARTAAAEHRDVYVWPNPYRYDGNYSEQGYENHDQSLWYDRARRVHFGNLPAKCKISILSLDGDLIKEIFHEYPPDDSRASHDAFDLISRAGLLVVSGIYYWVVESDDRTQMGKFVVIE